MQEKYGSRFFSPLLPGFTKKLLIPKELAKNICTDNDTRKVATIQTCGKIWHVEFYKEMGDYYLGGKGWENFVEAHGLEDYELLVFRYCGNMVFGLRIFDKITCCEKKYPYGSRAGVRESTIFLDDDDDDEKPSVVQKPTRSCCKKRKGQELNHTTISGELPQDEVPAGEGNCSRELSFEKTIKAHHLTRGRLFMGIPSEFLESSGREHGEFMLRDPQGQTWPVTLHRCKPFGAYISKGWLDFARGNKLKEGDRCIFESSSSQQRRKRVINFKVLNHTPARQIASRMPKSAPEDSGSPNKQNMSKTRTSGAHFGVTITTPQLSRHYLYVPKSFKVAASLERLSRVILVDPERRRWSFGLRHIRIKGSTNTYLTRSWRQFVVSNRLRGGDKCVFEALKEANGGGGSSSVIRVQILRITKQE